MAEHEYDLWDDMRVSAVEERTAHRTAIIEAKNEAITRFAKFVVGGDRLARIYLIEPELAELAQRVASTHGVDEHEVLASLRKVLAEYGLPVAVSEPDRKSMGEPIGGEEGNKYKNVTYRNIHDALGMGDDNHTNVNDTDTFLTEDVGEGHDGQEHELPDDGTVTIDMDARGVKATSKVAEDNPFEKKDDDEEGDDDKEDDRGPKDKEPPFLKKKQDHADKDSEDDKKESKWVNISKVDA